MCQLWCIKPRQLADATKIVLKRAQEEIIMNMGLVILLALLAMATTLFVIWIIEKIDS